MEKKTHTCKMSNLAKYRFALNSCDYTIYYPCGCCWLMGRIWLCV